MWRNSGKNSSRSVEKHYEFEFDRYSWKAVPLELKNDTVPYPPHFYKNYNVDENTDMRKELRKKICLF